MERYEQYIGKTLNGKYLIKELLGIGGMAYVFKASVIASGETVSIKILNEEFNHDEKAVKRFMNESKAVSMLCHKNIVGIYDVGFEKDIHYIAMEYVEGITLKEYIDYKKVLDWNEAVYYISQILKALGHAHSVGIIHRDVKPQNIMITREGTIKVMDFGIAKMINSESITMTDKAIGTVDYISPEQASGKNVGFYSDIYSVGIMLYEMTTGVLPFVAESPMAVAMMQVQDNPEPPTAKNPSLPRGLEQIILKAMNKEPDERFSSCGAMDKAISLLSQDPTTLFADRSSSGKNKRAGEKRSSSFLPVIAGVTIAFFLVAAVTAANIGMKFYKTQLTDTGTDIRIPELVGKKYSEELVLDLRDDRFEVTAEYGKYDPDKSVGEIIEQNPDGGSTRKLSNPNSMCSITVTVNSEPGKVPVDDYSNTEARLAKIQLSKLGLICETVTKPDNAIIEGFVIETEPAAGETVAVGSTVTLYVSSGAQIKSVKVPSIIGLDAEQAKKELQQVGISIGEIIYKDSDEPANTVISSSIEEGQSVPEKITSISLTLSRGPAVLPHAPDDGNDEDKTEDISENTDGERGAQDSDSADLNENEKIEETEQKDITTEENFEESEV
ncbi:MAG: protein kinase [Clostridia bacterium]|nr:protein kinase [Clostridia bacterium]